MNTDKIAAMNSYELGINEAITLYKAAALPTWLSDMAGRLGSAPERFHAWLKQVPNEGSSDLAKVLLRSTYGASESSINALRKALAVQKNSASELAAKGVGGVSRHLSRLPLALGAGAKEFGTKGLSNAAVVGAGGLGLYGAHQAYKNLIEPNLPTSAGPVMYQYPEGGMF